MLKNNTSTTIYPKCHNTKSKACLVLILSSFSSPPLARYSSFSSPSSSPPSSSSSSSSSGTVTHSHRHAHTYELITRKFFTARDHLHVGCAERRQSCSSSWAEKGEKERGRREKKWATFPILRTLSARPLARSLAFLLVSFPIALVSCTKNSLMCPVAHSIMDLKIVTWLSL